MISESGHPLFASVARSGRAIITKHLDNISFALVWIRKRLASCVPPFKKTAKKRCGDPELSGNFERSLASLLHRQNCPIDTARFGVNSEY